jgi:nucleotide-binding universal stress UspA family protein
MHISKAKNPSRPESVSGFGGRVETEPMRADPKTIAVFLDASPSGDRRAVRAATFAKRWDAHLVGVHVVYKGTSPHPALAYARSDKAIAGVVAHERRIDEACECAMAEVGDRFLAICAAADVAGEFHPIKRDKTAEAAIINSLHSDLLIIGHPEPNGLPDELSADRILLASGVPLLIIPNAWNGETIGSRVMISWNASPEARRAVSDAMCFLVAASSVTALVVDPAGHKWLGGAGTGCDISQHLERHGVHAVVEEAASRGRPKAEVILDRAMRDGCDLIVAGAQNPAHLREILFGGVTRTLLAKMPAPVLISR